MMTFKDVLKKNIAFISLGCDKNRVDLENIIGQINAVGFNITQINQAHIVIINTCSFILDARKESVQNILEMCDLKKDKSLEKIIVTGCLNEFGFSDLETSLPEVDAFVRVGQNDQIVSIIAKLYGTTVPDEFSMLLKNNYRVLSTPNHYAYLKIADGCNNFCSYCTIPFIRGRYKSETMEKILEEAKTLVGGGVNELILVAQDVTRYGEDLYGKKMLVELIRQLSKIKDLKWIRLLYCYPKQITDELIDEIANNDKVCKYIDIPFQHIDDVILKNMNRKETQAEIETLINKMRAKVPNISIRSTFILGFPGETDEQFQNLCDFVNKYRLNNVGFFKYSKEEGTRAGKMPDQIPARVKSQRLKTISKLQYECVQKNALKEIGREYEVVVDSIDGDYALCRNQHLCPDVDGLILVKHNNTMNVGEYYKIKITKVKDYDLIGELL